MLNRQSQRTMGRIDPFDRPVFQMPRRIHPRQDRESIEMVIRSVSFLFLNRRCLLLLSLFFSRLRHATDPVARSNGAGPIPDTLFSESVHSRFFKHDANNQTSSKRLLKEQHSFERDSTVQRIHKDFYYISFVRYRVKKRTTLDNKGQSKGSFKKMTGAAALSRTRATV